MTGTNIKNIRSRAVWDSRGRPTVEASVELVNGAIGRAIAPAGASRGRHEAIELRDGAERLGGFGVERAIGNINGEIAKHLTGHDATDLRAVDAALTALDGTGQMARLGGNATIAVSMAVLWASASAEGSALYGYLGGDKQDHLPHPEVQIFGGGAHAGRRVDIQDFMVVCPAAENFEHALTMAAEVYHAAGAVMEETSNRHGVADEGGFWPAFDSNEAALETLVRAIERAGFRPYEEVAIALDIAASEFYRDGHYHLTLDDQILSAAEFIQQILAWIERYPIVSVEDPLAEDDSRGLAEFCAAVPAYVQVVGDDCLVTNAARVRASAAAKTCNAVLIKPNQVGTVTATREAFDAAQAAG